VKKGSENDFYYSKCCAVRGHSEAFRRVLRRVIATTVPGE